MRPRVLLVAAEPGIALQVLFCLEAMGAETHVMASARARHLGGARNCASLESLPETVHPVDCAAALDACARRLRADIIVPSGTLTTRLLAEAKPHLQTPTAPVPERHLLSRLDDKFAFSEMVDALGIPVPKTVFIGPRRHLSLQLLERELGYPLVVKPTDQGNSNGVATCRDRAELIARIVQNPHYPYDCLIAQEFIPGFDIDLSVMARDGEIVASAVQRRIGRAIAFIERPDFVDIGRQIAAATGLSGAAHFDARLDSRDGTIKLVECNPRFWASITASLWCGVNFVAAAICAATGAPWTTQTVAPQTYLPPTPLMAALLTTPWRRTLWTPANLNGLRQAFANFKPYMAEERIGRTRHLAEQRRIGTGFFAVPGFRFGKG